MRHINFENTQISYELTYKDVKNINLRIKPDGSICVSANNFVPSDKIDEFVFSKSKYILKSLKKYSESDHFSPKLKKYVSGESFRLLGRDLRLKLKQGKKENIDSDGVYIYLTIKNKDDFAKKEMMITNWINKRCQEVFKNVVTDVYCKFKKYDVSMPRICIREMSSRWGSCQPKRGVITLNKHLIEMPRNCIEYVVLHEFCHYIQPNHSKKFYIFLQMMMPDWRERKRSLENR